MQRFCALLVIAVVCLGAASCGTAASSSGATPTSVQPAAPTTQSSAPISDLVDWSDAVSHIGESVTVEGPVAGTDYAESSSGSPTFLNVGVDYPDPGRFTVVIWGEDRSAFSSAPESTYEGKTIRVTGSVSTYEGATQVEVTSPDAIEIIK
jgi:DNA/RNA endonuclease YhcR with UshA esterase domain